MPMRTPRRSDDLRAAHAARALPTLALFLAAACMGGGEPGTSDSAAGIADAGSSTVPTPAPATGAVDEVSDPICAGEGPTVDGRRVGAVQLGMTADALRRTCYVTDTTFSLGEGLMERGLATRVVGASVVALLGPGDTVSRILVREAGLLTERQIGVTSNLMAIRRRHPTVCALAGEGRVLVASPEQPGMSFVLSTSFRAHGSDAAAGRISALPDTSSVTGIWVHGVQTTCEPS